MLQTMDGTNTPKLNISPTVPSDLPDLASLWNDGRVMRWVGFPQGLGYDDKAVEEWYSVIRAKPDCHHFVVRDVEQGFCGELYYAIDRSHQLASLDIKLVPEAQGKGIATEALRALIDLVFQAERDVDAVWVDPRPENKAAQRLYSRCGLNPHTRPEHLGDGPSYWELRRSKWSDG